MQLKHTYSMILFIIFILIATYTPVPGSENLTIDFSERLRVISWDNPITLDSSKEESSTFTRHRTSLGLNWKFTKNGDFYFKATNEFRIYFKPNRDFNIHEIFIDNLYLKLRNLFRLPVTLTIGRQNIVLGEGFIMLDGNTYDGSRSIFFDAVRADIDFRNKGTLSVFSLYAQKNDDLLPVLNDKDQLLNEKDIKGYGIYYQGKTDRHKAEIYYLNKQTDIDEDSSWSLSTDTIGTRLSFSIQQSFKLTAEGAIQNGSYYGNKIRAFGGHFHFDRDIKNRFFKKVTIGGVLLSGNSPGDPVLRGWDPPFSKWPKWSESYIYTLINEGGIGNWSNLSSIYISILSRIFKNGHLNTTLNFLGAPKQNFSPDFPGGSGKYRGFLLINRVNFALSKSLSAHFLWEHFRPGNYYFSNAGNYNWVRFELMYRKKIRR